MNQTIHQFKADFFKCLGNPVRLAILEHLRNGEKSVNELQLALGADQSTVSQQLARLRAGNIVDIRKKGTSIYYTVRDPLVFHLLDVGRELFNHHLTDTQEMIQHLSQEPD